MSELFIRDPIHGIVPVGRAELAVIDHPYFQRLRTVKQLGFSELAFPGATHSRYAHSLGAMHLGARMFDAAVPPGVVPDAVRARFRQTVRLAVLCHDLGHPPLSHASERAMPARTALELPAWLGAEDRRATHEDYTLLLLLQSELAGAIRAAFGDAGITPEHVAALVHGAAPPDLEPSFVHDGTNYMPLLRQIVSSELDADRMDYLRRDSFFTGVEYGRFDHDWLIANLTHSLVDGAAYLALSTRAVFAFEDFLLSRYHMFLSVYFHHVPVCFDEMLHSFYEDPEACRLPADAERYLHFDDVHLLTELRRSANPWAALIVRRRPFRLLVESNAFDDVLPDHGPLVAALRAASIPCFTCLSHGVLSKYFEGGEEPPMFFVDPTFKQRVRLEEYTPLFQRYAGGAQVQRLYVHPDHHDAAQGVLRAVTG